MSLAPWESALRAWVVSASGYASAKVYFANDGGARPAPPCISLNVVDLRRVGQDWVDTQDAASPTPGAEIEYVARGVRVGTLRLQCFAVDPAGTAGARAVLDDVVLKLALPSISDALDAANVSVSAVGPVQSTAAIVNTTLLEPRAMVDATIRVAAQVSEFGTYIESVDIDGTVDDGPATTRAFSSGFSGGFS